MLNLYLFLVIFTASTLTVNTREFNPEIYDEITIKNHIACSLTEQPLRIPKIITTGLITSPDLSAKQYAQKVVECSWTIHAPQGFRIWIRMLHSWFDPDCNTYLEFYDGESKNSPIIERFCRREERNFVAPSNIVHIVLRGIGNSMIAGFKLYFKHLRRPIITSELNNALICQDGQYLFRQSQQCDGSFQCVDGTDEESCGEHFHGNWDQCGNSSIQVIKQGRSSFSRIYGGNKAKHGSWPWTASIRLTPLEPEGHVCGAVILNSEWILTAAHCLLLPHYKYEIHFGRYNQVVDNLNQLSRKIKKVIAHPNYTEFELPEQYMPIFDIALVQLSAPLPLDNKYIKPICLPNKFDEDNLNRVRYGYITGWGSTRNTGYELVLKEAVVPILSDIECSSQITLPEEIRKTIICAGNIEGKADTCKGDSGGPLMVLDEQIQKWKLIGITSTGTVLRCGEPMKPGIYSKVSAFLDFILDSIN